MIIWKRVLAGVWSASLLLLVAGCVDQHPEGTVTSAEYTEESETSEQEEVRLVATSRAAVSVCEKLDLDLTGVPTLEGLPSRYDDATRVGSAMGPDMEIIASLYPTEVIGPDTLGPNLVDGYAAAGIPSTFLNLRSVEGLYDAVQYLGDKYDRTELADELIAAYQQTLADFQTEKGDQEGPKVLILMGLPGSYIECTSSSYVGNLVELAGGVNVVTDPDNDFVSWNTEDLLALDPDIILRTVHALPEQVQEMFEEEFSSNDIWKHFRAVEEGNVYDLDYTIFGMSATFDWSKGLKDLLPLFYGDSAS